MAGIYGFTDYKSYLLSWIAEQPRKGRGQFAKFAEVSGLHKATVSHVFKGAHHFSLEQALKVSDYLGLSPVERKYFLLLVNHDRAGTAKLREYYRAEMEEEKTAHANIAKRVTRSRELSSEERATFYSNWAYSAIRILSSIPQFQKREAIFKELGLTRAFGNGIVEFLLSKGLCVEKNGRLGMGPQMTHLEGSSPLVSRHHGNWRVKAMERHPMLNANEELAYTAPMSLSSKDAAKVREFLLNLVQKVDEVVGPSPCERLFCLNLDWFEVRTEKN